jgi:hypothetical protein
MKRLAASVVLAPWLVPWFGVGAVSARRSPTSTARWAARYAGAPRDGVERILETDASAPVSLRVIDQYFGLSTSVLRTQYFGLHRVAAPTRPGQLIQSPFGFGPSDQTYVGRTFAGLPSSGPAPDAAPCRGAPHEKEPW